MDFPYCLLLLLSISVFFTFQFFCFYIFLVVGSVRQIKLTYVGFRAHVKIASRIVSYCTVCRSNITTVMRIFMLTQTLGQRLWRLQKTMKECRFVMWIITNFGQFVLFCVEFDMCKGLIDFIVLLLMVEVSVCQCPVRHCPVLQFQSTRYKVIAKMCEHFF